MLMRRGEPFDLPKAGGDAFSVAVWRPEDEAFWRAHRGLAWRTLVVSFPGSPRACDELFGVVEPVLEHAIRLLRSDPTEHL